MDLRILIFTVSTIFLHRGLLRPYKTFNCVVLLCAFFCIAAYGLCSTNGMQNLSEYDACASSGENCDSGFSNTVVGGSSLGCGSPPIHNSFENVCPDTHSFCFPSMLSGFDHKEKSLKAASLGDSGSQCDGPLCVGLAQDGKVTNNRSLSSDYGIFKLLNGGVASCSLNSRDGVNDAPSHQTKDCCKNDIPFCGDSLHKQKTTHSWSKNSEMSKSSSFDGSFTPNVRIDPTVLDWGKKYLYSPSVAFLTMVNTCNDSVLHLYEPFSNDLQFYPCNFSEVSLGPGESALICFVFFPRCLGSSSAQLILQTSSGGFMVEANGYAGESPLGIKPILGLEISPGGTLSKNFSLLNPFDGTLYVVEITTWLSVSLGHNSVEIEAICGINNFQDLNNLLSSTIKDRLVVNSSQIDSPINIAIKPHRNWEIGSNSSETLMEIDITVVFEGKLFGAFCLHLMRSSQDKSDAFMVPIEAETDSHFGYEIVGMFVSATLEGLTARDGGETVITISLRNHAPSVLSFVKVIEVADSDFFHIKYMEGLLLYPNTVTQVGIIYCNHLHTNLHDMSAEVSNLLGNCKLVILTNDTTSPHVEIPCEDALHICFEHQRLSFFGIKDKSKFGNMRAGYAVRSMRLPPNVKVTETADVNELVLGNWVSQGTTNDMSVLEDHEVLFPMVQVGSYVSMWISVKNPSHHPVMMQLILNPGEIIDECRGRDDNLHHFSSGNLVIDEAISRAKYGFSVPESAVTEAYVHPYDYATLGPIIFYPSKRCGWNGSALIRNNLSGVEWIPLRGFGGLLSLVILERSEHVQSINFDLKMHNLNFSLPHALLHMKEMTYACSQPLVKELYAKNTGDLPLEVKTMRVSGRECGLDGFKIHDCRGFSLQPGESIKLLISYQIDFSAAVVHRDLELALASGIFLIPMKASVPFDVLYNCKKCMFWMRVKKWFLGFLLVASLISLVFCFISPQTITLGSLDYLCKNEDNSIHITLNCAGKTPLLPCNQRKGKLSVSGKMNNLFCSVGKGTASTMRATCVRYSYNLSEPPDKEISQHLMQASENHNEGKLPSTAVQGSDVMEASQLGKLVINIGKEKGSRRRKKKSPGAKLTALSDFSSSKNRNSTPSSPLSPVAPASTKCSWPLAPDVEQPPLQALSLTTQKAAKHPEKKCQASASTAKPNILEQGVPVKCCSNNISSPKVSHSASTSATSIPVKILCATSPIPGGSSPSFLVSTSSVTLSARAPGSKLDKPRTVIAPKAGLADEYTYDIWGDHLSGLHLLVPKNVTCMKSSPAEKNFDSFFVGGPQAIK